MPFDILGGIDWMQQQGEQGRARFADKLMGQAYMAPPEQRQSALQQLAGRGFGREAMATGAVLEQQDGVKQKRQADLLAQGAEWMSAMTPEQRAQAWPTFRQRAASVDPDLAAMLPEAYDDAQIAPFIQQIAGGASDLPAGYQEFNLLTKAGDLSPEDRAKAARVKLGLDGRASNAGFGFDMVEDAQGNPRPQRRNPRDGSVEVFHAESSQWVPLGAGAGGGYTSPAPQPAPQAVPQQSVDDITAAIAEAANQLRAQNVPEAQIDAWAGEQMRKHAPPGMKATSGGQMPPQAAPAAPGGDISRIPLDQYGGGSVPVPDLGRGRRKEDQVAAEEAAKRRVALQFAPAEAEAEANRTRVTEDAKLAAERAANAPKTIARYESALSTAANVTQSIDKALDLISPLSAGFGGARFRSVEGTPAFNLAAEVQTIKANLGFDRLQQMRDNSPTGGALGQVAVQELVALQATIANLDPDQSEEQLRANLQRVKDHYARWRASVESAIDEERRAAAQPAQGQGQSNRIRYDAKGNRI